MSRGFRLYVYTAALIALLLVLAGSILALWQFLGGWGGSPVIGLGVAGMALIAWGVHVWLAARAARPLTLAAAAERSAAARKAYLALGQLGALTALVAQALSAARLVFLRLLGEPEAAIGGRLMALGAGALIALAVWGFVRWTATRDGDLGRELGRAASWRRGYIYLAALAGAGLASVGAGELLRGVLSFLSRGLPADTDWRGPLALALAGLVVGLPLAIVAWARADRWAALAPAVELNTASRVTLRAACILVGTALTVLGTGYLLTQVFRGVLRLPVGSHWQLALAYVPVAAVLWLTAARGARRDALLGGEGPQAAAARRIVRYGVAAAASGAFAFGLVEFARLILLVALGVQPVDATAAAEWWARFARAAALVLVAAPTWWGYGWSQQVRARTIGPAGDAERAALVRRIYLVAITLLSGCVVLAALGFGVFLALNLRSTEAVALRSALAGAGAAGAVALVWALVHGLILRGDARWPAALAAATAGETAETWAAAAEEAPAAAATADAPPQTAAPLAGPRQFDRATLPSLAETLQARPAPAFVVIDGADGAVGAGLLAALRSARPDGVLWPIGLNAAAHVAMLDALGGGTPPAVPADAITRAVAVLGPSDMLASGGMGGEVTAELAGLLAETPARLLLLPPRDPRLRWVAAPDWPLARWVENAVIEAANAVDAMAAG